MKAKKFHEMSTQELLQQETELKTELFNLRFQHATGQLSNPIVIKSTKRDIARVKTILRERELSAAK
ncbi:50S ribosomal protein L29 [Christensenella sp. MSJ-20]|uniref:50S ribosomal protein L29 n=1 Tax=Christensenella sp. MSJ-20 TaxID=2841518 RepID=UPI000D7B69C3|nr:MAG: 50S ribosomal protein L29 [Bacillota bacterium]QWT55120.1 50S ribosomal protein L29 [Christensenella sp. MSJ-20]